MGQLLLDGVKWQQQHKLTNAMVQQHYFFEGRTASVGLKEAISPWFLQIPHHMGNSNILGCMWA